MQAKMNAPYWITKNPYEAVAIGLRKVLNKWRICAVQYFKQNVSDEWEPVGKGISLDKSLYSELVNSSVKIKDRLSEPGECYSIRKSNLEELRISIKASGKQYYVGLRSYIREVTGDSTDQWSAIGEEINIPTSLYSQLIQVLKQIGLNLEILRKEESIKRDVSQKPRGRKQYFIDERGFLVSKELLDELRR